MVVGVESRAQYGAVWVCERSRLLRSNTVLEPNKRKPNTTHLVIITAVAFVLVIFVISIRCLGHQSVRRSRGCCPASSSPAAHCWCCRL